MNSEAESLAQFSDQMNAVIAENRRLRQKGDADDATIRLLKQQYEELNSSVESMVDHYRRRERELVTAANNAKVAYTEISGLLNQAAATILQAARAQIGDQTPEKMPAPHLPHIVDDRLPIARLSM